jgi:hypothetical protein
MVAEALIVLHVLIVASVAGLHVGSAIYFNPAIDALPLRAQLETQRAVNLRFAPSIAWLMVSMVSSGLPVLWLVRAETEPLALFGAAVACLIVSIVTTVSINVPINKRVMTEPLDALEASWPAMRARWNAFNNLRTVLIMLALALELVALAF